MRVKQNLQLRFEIEDSNCNESVLSSSTLTAAEEDHIAFLRSLDLGLTNDELIVLGHSQVSQKVERIPSKKDYGDVKFLSVPSNTVTLEQPPDGTHNFDKTLKNDGITQQQSPLHPPSSPSLESPKSGQESEEVQSIYFLEAATVEKNCPSTTTTIGTKSGKSEITPRPLEQNDNVVKSTLKDNQLPVSSKSSKLQVVQPNKSSNNQIVTNPERKSRFEVPIKETLCFSLKSWDDTSSRDFFALLKKYCGLTKVGYRPRISKDKKSIQLILWGSNIYVNVGLVKEKVREWLKEQGHTENILENSTQPPPVTPNNVCDNSQLNTTSTLQGPKDKPTQVVLPQALSSSKKPNQNENKQQHPGQDKRQQQQPKKTRWDDNAGQQSNAQNRWKKTRWDDNYHRPPPHLSTPVNIPRFNPFQCLPSQNPFHRNHPFMFNFWSRPPSPRPSLPFRYPVFDPRIHPQQIPNPWPNFNQNETYW